MSQLRMLTVGCGPGDEVTLTDAQIRELRSLTSVQQLSTPYGRRSQADFLVRMLRPGHALQWTSLGSALVTDLLAAVLGSLPTLAVLKAELQCADLRFFSQLRSLSDVELTEGMAAVDPAELVRGLRHCSQISRLTLRMFDLTCAQLEHLLSAFPLLCSLTLARLPLLESLRCLSTPALAASLRRLELRNLPRCPPPDISHLFDLRSFRLIIIDSLSAALSASQKAEFAVPSKRFPMLKAALCLGLHSIARIHALSYAMNLQCPATAKEAASPAPLDHYSRLGVAYDASAADIAAAFRRQARIMHPDKLAQQQQQQQQQQSSGVSGPITESDRRAASARFCALQQSYAVLSNEHSRAQYDHALKAGGLVARSTVGSSSSSSSLPSSSAFSGVLSVTDVDLDDLAFAEDAAGEAVYCHACRCGSTIVASERDLECGIDLFPCNQCSIVMRVAFEWRPQEGQEQAAGGPEDEPTAAVHSTGATAAASSVREMD